MAGNQKTSVRTLSRGHHTQTKSAVVPDLTFHEMRFLKRSPPPKPVLRGRERAKRRGEKELEEVSAFFLHKGMPEVTGISGQDQPPFSDAASLGMTTTTCDSSTSIIDAPLPRSGSGEQFGHKSPGIDRGSSRGATNWTWSSSYEPRQRGVTQASAIKEHVPAQGSTPAQSRNALERTGVFDNTGINHVDRQKVVSSATSRSKNNPSTREPLAVVADEIVNRQPDTSRQDVRIVRYHDRGVMTGEEAEDTAGCRQKSAATPEDSVEQPRRETSAKIKAPAESVNCCKCTPENGTASHSQGEEDVYTTAAFHAEDHATGLDRPRSPKCWMVEQLEAAAEDVGPHGLQSGLASRLTSLPLQENMQSAYGHHNHSVAGHQNASEHGCLEIKPGFVDHRQLNMFEEVQENNRLNTIAGGLRDSQQAHEVGPTPQIALKPTNDNPHWVSNTEQPVFDVQIASSVHGRPYMAHSMARYALGNPSSVPMMPPPSNTGSHPVVNDWAATGHGQFLSNQYFPRSQTLLPGAAKLSPQRSHQQESLEEYIARIEDEVLCRPQEDDVDGDSPLPGWHGLLDNDSAYLECVPQAQQSSVGAYDPDLPEDGHSKNRSIGGTHYGSWGGMQNSDVDQEEQRFRSTFWRPNCH